MEIKSVLGWMFCVFNLTLHHAQLHMHITVLISRGSSRQDSDPLIIKEW